MDSSSRGEEPQRLLNIAMGDVFGSYSRAMLLIVIKGVHLCMRPDAGHVDVDGGAETSPFERAHGLGPATISSILVLTYTST